MLGIMLYSGSEVLWREQESEERRKGGGMAVRVRDGRIRNGHWQSSCAGGLFLHMPGSVSGTFRQHVPEIRTCTLKR